MTYYTHANEQGYKITVYIVEDCGMVNGENEQWHKVICRAIGFNNSMALALDFATLTPEAEHVTNSI